jgi:hypothetical protein
MSQFLVNMVWRRISLDATHIYLLDIMVIIVSEEYLRSMFESDFGTSSFRTSGLFTFLGGETIEVILPE